MGNLSDFLTGAGSAETAVFQDVQASGVAGQLISFGTDTVLQFNTTVVSKSFVSLSSNQLTIDEGTYEVVILDPCQAPGTNIQTWINDTSNVSYGGSKIIVVDSSVSGFNNFIKFSIVIPSGGKVIEVLQRATGGNIARGITVSPANGGEYYQAIYITKVG